MLNITATTSKGRVTANCPESWEETSVHQFQRIIKEWDGQDWVKLFSILSGLEVDDVATSTDYKLETALYQSIQFVFARFELESAPIPDKLELRTIWYSDCPLIPDSVVIPKKLGRLTIAQAIQARKLLEGCTDVREAIGTVTAIYLQPLIDRGKFDMLRAVEIEQVILKMPISKIYPVGFFLLRKLNGSGPRRENVWHRIRNWMRTKRKTI